MKKITIILLLITTLSSCNVINNYEWEAGCEICKDKGGVRHMNSDLWVTRVRCNNGDSEEI
jgi:hypothetical protein